MNGRLDFDQFIEDQLIAAFNAGVFNGEDHTASLKFISMNDEDKMLDLFKAENIGVDIHFTPECIEKGYSLNDLPPRLKIIEFKTPGLRLEFDHYMVPKAFIKTVSAKDYQASEGTVGRDEQGLYIDYPDFNHPMGQLKRIRQCAE